MREVLFVQKKTYTHIQTLLHEESSVQFRTFYTSKKIQIKIKNTYIRRVLRKIRMYKLCTSHQRSPAVCRNLEKKKRLPTPVRGAHRFLAITFKIHKRTANSQSMSTTPLQCLHACALMTIMRKNKKKQSMTRRWFRNGTSRTEKKKKKYSLIPRM